MAAVTQNAALSLALVSLPGTRRAMPLPQGLIDEYRKQFNKIDRDGSGSINKDELAHLLASLGHEGGNVDEKMAELDGNEDGKVTSEEFLGLMERLAVRKDASELEEIFQMSDEAGMGFIDYGTLRQLLLDIVENEDRVIRGLRAMRIDQDEHIDCEQFIEIANSI